MALTGGTTTNYGLKKCRISEPFDTDWGSDFNANYDTIDSTLKTLSDGLNGKASLSGATFTGEMAIERTGAPGSLRISGNGNVYNYSQVNLEESGGKYWAVIHRKYSDYPYGLIIEQYDGSNYRQRVIISGNGNVGLNIENGFGTSAAKVLAIGNGTAPTSSPVDTVQLYSADQTAGNATLHIRTENGSIIKLYKESALTAQLTTITHTEPGTPDYAIQDLTDSGGYGFVTKDEGNTVLKVIANLQTRLSQLETRLRNIGLLT